MKLFREIQKWTRAVTINCEFSLPRLNIKEKGWSFGDTLAPQSDNWATGEQVIIICQNRNNYLHLKLRELARVWYYQNFLATAE